MKTNLVGRLLLLVGTSAVIWGTIPGCGPSSGSYCNKICECEGCSDPERADCVDSVDDARKLADDNGCAEKFDAYFSCIDSEVSCTAGRIDADGCDAELTALAQCGVPFAGSNVAACLAYVDHVNSLSCIGDVTIDPSQCDAYKDIKCDVASYFSCISSHLVCGADGMLAQDEYAKTSECEVPPCAQ